jgi:hypothetical protein
MRLAVLLVLGALLVLALLLARRPQGPDVDARGREVWREAEAEPCLAALGEDLPGGLARGQPIGGAGSCGLDRPLVARSFAVPLPSAHAAGRSQNVAIGAAQPMSCPLAEATRRWLMESVQPASLHHFRQPVRALRTLGTYNCRPINTGGEEANSGRLSEHAFANALDVAGFTLADGREIALVRDWEGDAARRGFLRDVRDGACKAFRTTLGPEYNDLHRDHFHLDMARRPFGPVCR